MKGGYMPQKLPRQGSGPESYESAIGDAVPFNGSEEQFARREHMRELTTARQAAEQRLTHPGISRGGYDYRARMAEREGEVRAELARIDAEHQAWLRAQGLADSPERGTRRHLPPDIMAPG